VVLATRRKLEDLDAEVRRVLGKKQEQFIVDLYTDLQVATQKHAATNNIDLVLTYSDPGKEDLLKFPTITRKIAVADQGGSVLLFIRGRIDITQAVLKIGLEAVGPAGLRATVDVGYVFARRVRVERESNDVRPGETILLRVGLRY
jgi:hypothetical protein